MNSQTLFVITGGMGSGKSTLMRELRALGAKTIVEPAREILAEQRAIGGRGVPESDPRLFVELMLARAIWQYKGVQASPTAVFFDRGVADNLAYGRLFGFEERAHRKAAQTYRYNQVVFFAPSWQEIYHQDKERRMTFEEASRFGDEVRSIYEELGYSVTEIPRVSPLERARFILDYLSRIV